MNEKKLEVLKIIANFPTVFTEHDIFWAVNSKSDIDRNTIQHYLNELTELRVLGNHIATYNVKNVDQLHRIINELSPPTINLNEISTLDIGRFVIEYVKGMEDRIKTLEDVNALLQKKLDEKDLAFNAYVDFVNSNTTPIK